MKPMCFRNIHTILVTILVGIMGAALVPSPALSSDKLERQTVVYGGSTWLGHYPVWVGIKKEIFEKRGLDVQFQQFYASSGRMGSLVAGDLDFASTGSISAIALMAAGVDRFSVIGSQDSYATVEGIIAKEGISSVKDLKGKKLAVTFASSAHVLVLDILKDEGLDPMTRQILQEQLIRIYEAQQKTIVFITHSIDEALMLSSRIVIMTARPGQIARDMPNDLPHPRDASLQLSDAYVTLKREIWDTVQSEVLKSLEIPSG